MSNQHTIRLTPNCNLRCFHCSLWKQHAPITPPTSIPQKKFVNLVGGDPFCYPDLLALLRSLRARQIKIRFWTNGLFPLETWDQVLPFLHTVYLYLPAFDKATYRQITGLDGFDAFMEIAQYLKLRKKKFFINVRVRPDNIAILPEVYEMAFKNKYRLLLHYQRDAFNKDSIGLIKRFYGVHRVSVLEELGKDSFYCAGYSTASLSTWQTLRNQYLDIANALRKRFNI